MWVPNTGSKLVVVEKISLTERIINLNLILEFEIVSITLPGCNRNLVVVCFSDRVSVCMLVSVTSPPC